MAYIGRQLARGENKLFDDISSSFNGSTTTFNLTVSSVATATATPYQLFVSLGGVMQKPNTDFTTAGNQITFTTAPAAGLSCWIMMQGDTIDQAAIPDASVTPSKISGTNFAFSGDLRLKDADGSHYVGFASPTTVASNKVWTLPAADGSASQYLQTNGSGVLSWASVSIGGGTGIDFNDNVKARWGTGNDLEIFHNASNSVINDAGTGDLLLQVGGTTQATISSTGVVIANNLTVSGTTTTINTQTLDVEDKNVVIGKVSSPSDTTADGGGWTLKGATDKTFNWVNSTDAWTSSEHIHILDSKKLLVGTGSDFQISHTGSHTELDSYTGNLSIRNLGTTGDIYIDAKSGERGIKVIQDGAVELYHNNVKKIETTSSGIDVTGSINVNGAALSTAPTVTATADGAIAANKPVVLQDNGTVKEISGTSDSTGSRTTVSSDQTEQQAIVFDPDTNKTVYFWCENGSGNTLKYKVATPASNNSISFGTERTAVSGSVAALNAVYSTVHNKFVLAYRGTNNNLYFKAGSMDSGNDSITWGSEAATPYQSGIENYRLALACDDDNGTVACAYRKSTNDNYVVGMLTSSSNNNLTVSSNGKDLGSSLYAHADDMVYDTNNNKYQVLWERINADTVQVNYFSVDSSNGNVTYSTSGAVIANYHSHDPKFKYDPVNQVYCCAWTKLSDSQVYARAFTFNGSSYTLGDEIAKSSTTTEPQDCGLNGRPSIQMHFNPDAGHFGYEYRAEPGGTYSGQHRLVRFAVSGTTTTEAIGDTLVGDSSYVNQLRGSYDTNLKKMVYTADTGNGHRGYVFQPEESNLNATRFLGFSTAAYSDTNTATIAITANTTTQSGLTTARKYYVTKQGGLSLTADNPSVEAGFSLSSTKLIIKS